jgi:hypothetical protein
VTTIYVENTRDHTLKHDVRGHDNNVPSTSVGQWLSSSELN